MTGWVSMFFTEHGRWPSAAGAGDYERSLGVWLNQQRVEASRDQMDPFRRAYLDQHLPGWQASAEDIWHDRAREASDFILANGRQPMMAAAEPGERLIGIWLSSQRALHAGGTLDFRRTAWLNAHCPGWLSVAEEASRH